MISCNPGSNPGRASLFFLFSHYLPMVGVRIVTTTPTSSASSLSLSSILILSYWPYTCPSSFSTVAIALVVSSVGAPCFILMMSYNYACQLLETWFSAYYLNVWHSYPYYLTRNPSQSGHCRRFTANSRLFQRFHRFERCQHRLVSCTLS